MPLLQSTYRAPRFLSGGHLQTLFATLFRRVTGVRYQRERVELDDGDFLDLDWSRVGAGRLVVLCHGLEGDTSQPYIRGMAKAFNRIGWDALAWNYRGCSGEPNRTLRAYHSGATEDLEAVLLHALKNKNYSKAALVGFSLGGNLILKYLGERGAKIDARIQKAVAFSVPCDLKASSAHLAKPANKIYMMAFLSRLKKKIRAKKKLFPGQIDDRGYFKLKTFKDFDDRYTATLHGFKDALDYWKQSSALGYLDAISIPTLMVNAQDDPFLPEECFPEAVARNHPYLYLETPPTGGHVGFVSFNEDGEYWSEKRAVEFINQR